jgi:hypothetical protein
MKTGEARTWRARVGVLAVLLVTGEARASSIDSSGQLVYDKGALMTFGFESLGAAQAVGASWLTWSNSSLPDLAATPVAMANFSGSLATGEDALEGSYSLRLTASSPYLGLGLLDKALFKQVAGQRVVVSMWGRSHGAEPELDIVYPGMGEAIGPIGLGRIVAIRTGNETSDGWAEYSTGPIDGSLWGDEVAAIILTARYTTTEYTLPLDSPDLFPGAGGPSVLDSTGYALVDAVEVDPAGGAPMAPSSCTQNDVASVCGDLGECMYGHCVDGSVLWGPVPQSADHRRDLVQRWEFTAEHLGGDRMSASQAPSVFTASALSSIESATTPRAFLSATNELIANLRDGHTTLGEPPSDGTIFHPFVDPFYPEYSGVLDVCLGLVEDDLPGGTGANAYAVFWVSPTGMLADTLMPGAQLVQVDGLSPDAWIDSLARFRRTLPNDPTSEPSGRALILGSMMAKYAQTAVFSTCTAAGSCTAQTVPVGQMTFEWIQGTKFKSATVNTQPCTPRFLNSVSSWTATNDAAAYDIPLYETVGDITSIELNGFEGAWEYSALNGWILWEGPFNAAFSYGTSVLLDFRQGHGGKFALGNWLAENIRGTGDPYAAFGVPRGDFDSVDPSWIFDPSLQSCVLSPFGAAPSLCGWTGSNIDESMAASPPFGSVKIAWLDGNDVSMNEITLKKLVGLPNVQIFGPHPTTGAFGEISYLPPILGSWSVGSTQVLDFRYGSTLSAAMAASWSSGTGVPPDQSVTQKLSDLLAGTDTALVAAETWLEAP